jgi:hypothetical protein
MADSDFASESRPGKERNEPGKKEETPGPEGVAATGPSRSPSRRRRRGPQQKTLSTTPEEDIKQTAAWRVKYGRRDSHGELVKLQLPPGFLGFHPQNRDGMGPNEDRCEQLQGEFIKRWDRAEAEHDSVCVEEAPGSTKFLDYNRAQTIGKKRLAQVTRQHLEFATIGHSHLRQTTHNAYDGVAVSGDNTILKPYCTNGKLDLALIKPVDAEYAQACVEGIRWEVLAYQVEVEQPNAITIMQSVLNVKSKVQMVEHEMQHLVRLSNILYKEGQVAKEISHVTAQKRLRDMGSHEIADHPDFVNLMSLALDLGGPQSMYLQDVKKFHERFVNAKIRSVNLSVIAALADVPVGFEVVRGAVIKQAYRGMTPDKRTGKCKEWLTSASIAAIVKEDGDRRENLKLAEAGLRRFRFEFRALGAYAGWTEQALMELFTAVEGDVANTLFAKQSKVRNLLEMELAIKDKFIRSKLTETEAKELPRPYAEPDGVAATGSRATEEAPMARIIEYDETTGRRVNKQDEQAAPQEVVKEAPVLGMDTVSSQLPTARLFQSIWHAHASLPEPGVKVWREGKGPWVVETTADYAAGQLVLLPLVPSVTHIVTDSKSIMAVTTEVETEGTGKNTTLRITSGIKGDTFIPPFWATERADGSRCNMIMASVTRETTQTIIIEDPVKLAKSQRGSAWAATPVPCMINSTPLTSGSKLVLQFIKPRVERARNGRATTWVDSAKKKAADEAKRR